MAGSLTDFQKAVQNLEKQTGIQGQAIYSSPQYAALVQQWFGDIPVPPGAEVVSRTPFSVTYKDAYGNQRTAQRNMDARYGDFGSVSEGISQASTQGPLGEVDFAKPLMEQLQKLLLNNLGQANQLGQGQTPEGLDPGIRQDFLKRLLSISDRLEAPQQFASLDPSVQGLLDAQKNAQLAQLQQQFSDQGAQLTAGLFGSGINRSSIAADQAGRLMGQQGLVLSSALGEASQRELAVRQLMAQLDQQGLAISGQNLLEGGNLALNEFNSVQGVAGRNQQLIADLLSKIMGQNTQRELGLGQLSLGEREQSLAERSFLNDADFKRQQLDLAQKQARSALLKNILGGVASLGLSLATGGLSSFFKPAAGGGGASAGGTGGFGVVN